MKVTTSVRKTLLIVDDIPDNINILLEFLTQSGFKVLVAKEGQAAIRKAEYAQPDLIMLDVMMPGMDGFEVCKILKHKKETREIPIIFMTALSDTLDKVKGFSLGAVDYITKPIQHEEVLARISTHLKLRHLQQQLETELKIRQEYAIELEKRNTELNTFARTVAHDLKNPLHGIVNLSGLLLDQCATNPVLEEESINYLQLIEQAGQEMFNTIEALLLLAGLSHQNTIQTQPIDMASVISRVVEKRLVYMLRDFQAQISLAETWPVAKGYAPWVEEVWANYLSNALKYGGQPPQLELGADVQANRMIRFWIHDNGPGLSLEAQAKLFTPFTRLHQTRVEGHGLGLSIVQQIIEKLGGQVGVDSVEGQGSTFYFMLPAA